MSASPSRNMSRRPTTLVTVTIFGAGGPRFGLVAINRRTQRRAQAGSCPRILDHDAKVVRRVDSAFIDLAVSAWFRVIHEGEMPPIERHEDIVAEFDRKRRPPES